jgi:hypothetical protein
MKNAYDKMLEAGWREIDIGFFAIPGTHMYFVDVNSGGEALFIIKIGCDEVWDVLMTAAEVEEKYRGRV